MKNKLGFTLIELLVVVLIIGILAAIALPQYRKSIEKAKVAKILTILQNLYQSAKVYQVATGNWPSSVGDLDVDIPAVFEQGGEEFHVWIDNNTNSNTLGIGVTRHNGKFAGTGFSKYLDHSYNIIPKETFLCMERRKGNAPLFSGDLGNYCSKILNGKAAYVSDKIQTAVWALP